MHRFHDDGDLTCLQKNHWARLREPEPRPGAWDDDAGPWQPVRTPWLAMSLAVGLLVVAVVLVWALREVLTK